MNAIDSEIFLSERIKTWDGIWNDSTSNLKAVGSDVFLRGRGSTSTRMSSGSRAFKFITSHVWGNCLTWFTGA